MHNEQFHGKRIQIHLTHLRPSCCKPWRYKRSHGHFRGRQQWDGIGRRGTHGIQVRRSQPTEAASATQRTLRRSFDDGGRSVLNNSPWSHWRATAMLPHCKSATARLSTGPPTAPPLHPQSSSPAPGRRSQSRSILNPYQFSIPIKSQYRR